ncbi:MAG: hypothetical protein M1821_003748 [Bathelium mastoideum]|nr:MAG: hypothetical protein M1821_003748 [Bathelium mastoideum]KAI9690831.1 MAG: hypothetical protein M1822_008450 [Bathelium mastoideum]
MKTAAGLLLLASALTASAHYTFPYLIANDNTTGEYQYVRMTANHYSNGPVTSVDDEALRCYEIDPLPTTSTSTVKAGSTVGFKLDTTIGHPGPILAYMAQAPSGTTAAALNASGEDWFKIYEQQPTVNASGLQWQSTGKDQFEFTLPSTLPNGDYLLRIEHIALHGAETEGGAQFYLACGQLTVTNGGNGSPSPKVAIPGVYKATDPGILINLYYPTPTNYTMPGPAVWGDSKTVDSSETKKRAVVKQW